MRSHVFPFCPDSHFAQSKNSYFARQCENSHFAQDNSGIVPIFTLRRTYTCIYIYIYIYIYIWFLTKYVLIYFITFVSSVCLNPGFEYTELKRYDDLPKQTWAISDPEHSARVITVPLLSRFGPIFRTFRPLLSQCSPTVRSFGSLDYSAVLL